MEFDLNEEELAIKNAAREFAEKEFVRELARECDERYRFPWELYKKAAKLGFIGISLPSEWGGQGMGCIEECLVTEEFHRVDSTLAGIISGSIVAPLVANFGSENQKEKYLPKICRGESVCAVALTEPNHGSDAGATGLETTAIKDGDEWVINGTKTFITHGNIADFVIVCCQTDPNAVPPYRGVSNIIVEKGTPGFHASEFKPKMGMRSRPTCELSFDNVRVPISNLLGQENRGFYQMMTFFDYSRVIIAARAVGIAQGVFERALLYSTQRNQFSRPLADFQLTQWKIAEMATKIEAARLLTYKAAWLIDKKSHNVSKYASMAKAYATKVAREATDKALKIYGGYGYIDSDLERFYRDTVALEIEEGVDEIQKYIIAREYYKEKGYRIKIV